MAQVVLIQPTIENCDPISYYQKSTPGEYSFQENPILYGGGRKWILKASNTNAFKFLALSHQKPIDVDLYVLNTSLIIWLNDYNKGIEIPYPQIRTHSIQPNSLGVSGLQIILENQGLFESPCDHLQPTELFLIPIYSEFERYYNDSIEQLFTFENFGVNKGEKMVLNSFYSIGKCLNFHTISLSSGDDDDDDQIGSDLNAYDAGYDNSGNADDIDMSYLIAKDEEDDYGHAGVDVQFFNDNQRGITRSRNEFEFEYEYECDNYERRESPKRIRC